MECLRLRAEDTIAPLPRGPFNLEGSHISRVTYLENGLWRVLLGLEEALFRATRAINRSHLHAVLHQVLALPGTEGVLLQI